MRKLLFVVALLVGMSGCAYAGNSVNGQVTKYECGAHDAQSVVNYGAYNSTIVPMKVGSDGTVTVSGGNWTNTANLNVGGGGLGTLDISGGLVTTGGGATIGMESSAVGRVTVRGNGTLQTAGGLIVGDAGNGTLNLQNGGLASVGNGAGILTLGAQSGSTGTINIGAFGGNSTSGILAAAEITGGNGTAVLNFNQTDNITFATKITGSTALKEGAGAATVSLAA